MYTVIKTSGVWTVGRWFRGGFWEPEGDHQTKEEALEHARRLNEAAAVDLLAAVAEQEKRLAKMVEQLEQLRKRWEDRFGP